MLVTIIGYILLLVGTLGWSIVSDPDVRYPCAAIAFIGVILIIEGAVSRVVSAIRESRKSHE